MKKRKRQQELLNTLNEEIRKQKEALKRGPKEPKDGESESHKEQSKNRKRTGWE